MNLLAALALTTFGPGLLLAATNQEQPPWQRVLFGVSGLAAMGISWRELTRTDRVYVEGSAGELVRGMQHELEHTSNTGEAMQIALDHLRRDPRYYQKLLAAGL